MHHAGGRDAAVSGYTNFESSTISTVLAWLFSSSTILPIVLSPLVLFADDAIPPLRRIFYFWQFICLFVLSPYRYVIFQFALAESFPFQSWSALAGAILAAVYVPIVFGILYIVTFGIPLIGTVLIEGRRGGSRKRLAMAALAAPLLSLAAWMPFARLLPFAGMAVYLLDPADLVRATNGPAYYVFEYLASPLTPMTYPFRGEEVAGFRFSHRDLVRLHVAAVYMSAESQGWFIREAYPELFAHLSAERSQR